MFIDREGVFLDSLSEALDKLYAPLDIKFQKEIEEALTLLGYPYNPEVMRRSLFYRWLMHSVMN